MTAVSPLGFFCMEINCEQALPPMLNRRLQNTELRVWKQPPPLFLNLDREALGRKSIWLLKGTGPAQAWYLPG